MATDCKLTRSELLSRLNAAQLQKDVPELLTDFFFKPIADLTSGCFVVPPDVRTRIPKDVRHLVFEDDDFRCIYCGLVIHQHNDIAQLTEAVGTREALALFNTWQSCRPFFRTLVHCGKTDATPSDVKNALKRTCVACGYTWNESGNHEPSEYPCPAAQRHVVSFAHLLKVEAHASDVGVTFNDKSNFLALCGAKDESPSCHAAFDRNLLCFVHTSNEEKPYEFEIRTSASDHAQCYRFLHLKRADLSDSKPDRRFLHAHANLCIMFGLIEPPTDFFFNVSEHTPSAENRDDIDENEDAFDDQSAVSTI